MFILCYNFIEDVTPIDKDKIEQQSDSKFIYYITST